MTILYKIFSILPVVEHDGYKYQQTLKISERFRKIFLFNDKRDYKVNSVNDIFLLLKHIILFIISIIYFPIILILIIKKNKFLLINHHQIGAYFHQLDCFSKFSKLNNKKYILILPNSFNNLKIFNFHFEKYIKIISSDILYFLFLPLTIYEKITFNPWIFETLNVKSNYNQIHSRYYEKYKKSSIDYKLELKLAKNFLRKKKIKNKIICFSLKDEKFHNYKSIRDVNENNYLKSIKYLISKNYTVIRFIHNNSQKFKIKKNYFEINIEKKLNNLLQTQLIHLASLVIVNQSGICNYNTMTTTPFLLCDAIPFNTINVIKKNDRFIFKRFYQKKLKRFLNIDEIINKKLHLYPEIYGHKNNIDIIDNTETEILHSILSSLKKNKGNQCKKIFVRHKSLSCYYSHSSLSKTFKI